LGGVVHLPHHEVAGMRVRVHESRVENLLGKDAHHLPAGLEKTWVFLKKPAQWFFGLFWVF
jgi:hypothetical protein